MNQNTTRILAGAICVVLCAYFLWTSRTPSSGSDGAAIRGDSTVFERPVSREARDDGIDRAKSMVYAMLDAAAQGNSEDYLRCFSGAKARELQALAQERGTGNFGQALKEVNAGIKGFALYDVEEVWEGRIELTCELVFAGHNEKQSIALEDSRQGWRIVGLEYDGAIQMSRPYGSPAAPVPPPEATDLESKPNGTTGE